jgi:tetratricopeptide (TPR) repeat protein
VHFLQLGQLGEKTGDYEDAAKHYLRGLEAGPVDTHTRYFLRNNLGYTLNQLERFAEAEPLLRESIQVDPERTNAYKNLGLCLWGLERHVEAAVSFIDATSVNAADARSLGHLEQLSGEHPEIANSIPDFDTLLSACRGAVAVAARHWPDLEAWWWQARKEAAAP